MKNQSTESRDNYPQKKVLTSISQDNNDNRKLNTKSDDKSENIDKTFENYQELKKKYYFAVSVNWILGLILIGSIVLYTINRSVYFFRNEEQISENKKIKPQEKSLIKSIDSTDSNLPKGIVVQKNLKGQLDNYNNSQIVKKKETKINNSEILIKNKPVIKIIFPQKNSEYYNKFEKIKSKLSKKDKYKITAVQNVIKLNDLVSDSGNIDEAVDENKKIIMIKYKDKFSNDMKKNFKEIIGDYKETKDEKMTDCDFEISIIMEDES